MGNGHRKRGEGERCECGGQHWLIFCFGDVGEGRVFGIVCCFVLLLLLFLTHGHVLVDIYQAPRCPI